MLLLFRSVKDLYPRDNRSGNSGTLILTQKLLLPPIYKMLTAAILYYEG